MSNSEPGPSQVKDTGQSQDRVSVIKKVTKDNANANAYEAVTLFSGLD